MRHRRAAWRASIAGLACVTFATAPVLAALSASVANLALSAATFSHSSQSSSGTMVLTAADTAVVGLGWNVTIQASAFVYSGPNSGSNIPAANFALTAANPPVRVSGQAIDATNGPKVPAASPVGPLNVARKVLQANALYGVGTYTQALDVTLTIPAQARTGTYTTTLTTTISLGP
jgi:hypothetical protein